MKNDWTFLFISFAGEKGDSIRYKFVIDCLDLDLAGIVELDKSLINIDYTDIIELEKQEKEKKIKEIKIMSEKLTYHSEHFAVLTVYYVLYYYHILNRFPYETGFVNPIRPNDFWDNKELADQVMQRFRKNREVEENWKIK